MIDFFKKRLEGIKKLYETAKAYPIVMTLFALLMFVISTLAEAAINKSIQIVFPTLDDAKTIMTNQEKNFSDIKSSLETLEHSLPSNDHSKLNELIKYIGELEQNSMQINSKLLDLTEENSRLNRVIYDDTLKKESVNLLLPNNSGRVIDDGTTIGVVAIYDGSVALKFSQNGDSRSWGLYVGESIKYKNHAGVSCHIDYLGSTVAKDNKVLLAKFSNYCDTSS